MGDVKGIVGEKLGMTQIFVETRAVPVTVIKAGPCVVTQVRTPGDRRLRRRPARVRQMRPRDVTKPARRATSTRRARGARATSSSCGPTTPAATSSARRSRPTCSRRATRSTWSGVSKGKGFTGVMKRHGFSGLRGSHGVHKKHRSPGAIGACATPSRVFKGMRMAGQSGNQRVTVLNLEVVRSDPERGLLLVKGAVPGPNGGLVMVRSAVKTPVEKGA